jgi:hypothetical protein
LKAPHPLHFFFFKTRKKKLDALINLAVGSNSELLAVNTQIILLWQLSVRNCFIRGSVVRYVLLPQDGVDIDILHDATRREARGG